MQLQLVVADFHLAAGEIAADAAAALPRLPGLETVLRYGTVRAAGGWREALARLAGRAELAGVAPARIASLALAGAGLPEPWLASPVHQAAGLDHLRLHRAGLLRLSPPELAGLATDFDQRFAGSGLRLLPLVGGFVLDGLVARGVASHDPADFLGADMKAAPPAGGDAAVLRRLGAELEMWLHEAPVNRERARRGALAVNALWLWGGGPAPAAGIALRQKSPSLPVAYADDAYSLGLWHGSGGEARAVPADLAALLADSRAPDTPRVVVVVSAAARDARDAALPRLDAEWWSPAFAALGAGRLTGLEITLGGRQLTLCARDRLRFWRRPVPWWQGLAT